MNSPQMVFSRGESDEIYVKCRFLGPTHVQRIEFFRGGAWESAYTGTWVFGTLLE